MNEILKSNFICDVINKDCTVGIPNIVGNKTPISLLSGSIPQLQFVAVVLVAYVPGDEINADSVLHKVNNYFDLLVESISSEPVDD